mgnify:FL=1
MEELAAAIGLPVDNLAGFTVEFRPDGQSVLRAEYFVDRAGPMVQIIGQRYRLEQQ